MNFKIAFSLLIIVLAVDLESKVNGKRVDTYLNELGNFSGVVLITQKDEIILKKGYGFASYEFDVQNTSQTKFPIASNTKSFTAAAILILQERNLLSVYDKIDTYIPGFPYGDTITIHHLLTHTSGIQNYYKNWQDVCLCESLENMVNAFKAWPLDFEPGSKYTYSNSGYTILAYIIEKVSGLKYEEFLSENIFKPLQMNNSGSNNADIIVKNKAYGYLSKNNAIYKAPMVNNSVTLLGNGDIYSSLEDMYKWDQALNAEKLLTKKSLDNMFFAHISMENSSRAHGYGWFIDTKCNKRVVEYSGALIGFLSKVTRFIDESITIVILTNVEDQEQFFKICDDIPTILFT